MESVVAPGLPGAPQVISSPPTSALYHARAGVYANLRYIKTRSSEKYQTIPSSNVDQYIKQIGDNPLSLSFNVKSKIATPEYVRLNAEVVMNGLISGKAYGVHLLFVPFS